MHFGFVLELSDLNLWNTDLLDTHLDLLSPDKYTDIPSRYFVCLRKIFKTSSRHVFKTFQDISSRRLQHVFSVTIFRLPRRLQDVFKTSLQDVFKTSSRRLGRRKIVTLKKCWRRLQDQQMFAGLVASDLRSETKGTRFESCCQLCAEVSFIQ